MGEDAAKREAVLRQAYVAFNARDIPAVLAVLTPDVEWANGMEGGYVHGHDELRDYWTRQWTVVDPHVEPTRFTHQDGETVIEVHQVVRDLAGAVLMDTTVLHAYQFAGDLVRRMEIRIPSAD